METKSSHSQHLCFVLSRFSERYQRYGVSGDDALLTGFLILLMVREVNSGVALPSSADELLNLVGDYIHRGKLAETADAIYPLLSRPHGSMVELAYDCSNIKATDQEYIETLDWVVDHLSVDAGLYATPREITELMVRLVPGGIGSTYLHSLKVGDTVSFTGPYGEFHLNEDPSVEVICVGGGCGMAPMKNIIYTLYSRWPQRSCWLFFGCRTTDDVFYLA